MSTPASKVRIARVYDDTEQDGARVLVDRLWPRGVAKANAPFAEWCKDVAPSHELRRWYGHDPAKYDQFVERYRSELRAPAAAAAFDHLRHLADAGPLTLVTASKAVEISQAAVLADELNHRR
ncbi:MAG TPA: DUF488 family protein [Nocardioidaceae bacterium]|nr:DUF488 family protein [Nocardioidaceae bacterium]